MTVPARLKKLAATKCKDGYGVTLAELQKNNWTLLSVAQLKKTGDLHKKITDDPGFLGALRIPMLRVGGEPIEDGGKTFYRYRLFFEEVDANTTFGVDTTKKKRYRQSIDTKPHAFIPHIKPLDPAKLAKDTDAPVYLIEGEPKCMAMAKLGYFTIGLSGVDMFAPGGRLPAELKEIKWKGRDVYICYDADWHDNPDVEGAIHRTARQITSQGGTVFVLDLPKDGPKGIDEYLIENGPKNLAKALNAATPYEEFSDFVRGEKGNVMETAANARLALYRLGYSFRFNELRNAIEVTDHTTKKTYAIDDHTVPTMRVNCQDLFGWRPGLDLVHDVIIALAVANAYHPVKDYLNELHWDGKPRLDTWLIDCLGAEDTLLNREICRVTLMGAAARALEPGIKFDTMTVLIGPQGTYKSTTLRKLCHDESWFTDSVDINDDPQKFMENTSGAWIVEAAEVDHMTKKDTSKIKAVMSRQVDKARQAYGRFTTERARNFVLIGTANSNAFLRDTTGNRRFLTLRCPARGNMKFVEDNRNQLWAEAAARFHKGETLYLSQKLDDLANIERDAATIDTAVGEVLREWFGNDLRGRVRSADVWIGLGMPVPKDRKESAKHAITETMSALGFEYRKTLKFIGKGPGGKASNTSGWLRDDIRNGYTDEGQNYWKPDAAGGENMSMQYHDLTKLGTKSKVAKINETKNHKAKPKKDPNKKY